MFPFCSPHLNRCLMTNQNFPLLAVGHLFLTMVVRDVRCCDMELLCRCFVRWPRVFCGHWFHHDCLRVWMTEPPFGEVRPQQTRQSLTDAFNGAQLWASAKFTVGRCSRFQGPVEHRELLPDRPSPVQFMSRTNHVYGG